MSAKKETALLVVKYGLALLLLLLLQTTFLPSLSLKALPDLLLPAVIAVSLIEGPEWGAGFALFAGLFGSALGEVGFSLLPFFYVAASLCAFLLSEAFDTGRKWPVFVLLNALFAIAGGLFTLFRIVATWTGYDILAVLKEVIAPQCLYTFLAAIPVSLFFALLGRKKRTKTRFMK